MLLKNLWCGKMSLRRCVAVAAVSSLLVLAACGGDSGTSAPINNESESSSSTDLLNSSSSSSEESSSGVEEVSSSSQDGSSCSSSAALNCSVLLEGETGWSWDVPKECRFNPNITYGTMTDSRDGQTYKTVKIGYQTWMAENLNYADSVKTPSLLNRSWCYDDKAENCAVAGRFYTWAAAIDSVKLATDADDPRNCGYFIKCSLPDTVYGVCPPGWHLPTNAEWETLFTEVGGSVYAGPILKSQTGWFDNGGGTDVYGFSALPVGNGARNAANSFSSGENAYFWSATELNKINAIYVELFYDMSNAYNRNAFFFKDNALSVRCLKN